ncbi:MAG: hydrolase 1, exosortase A system-associated [Pseudomonadota bacterium]
MTAKGPIEIEPFFLPHPDRALFCLHHIPRGQPVHGAVLYLHPFAEEMHKSRRMAALTARTLAGSGLAVLLVDLSGCGDSTGDFAEATWSKWREDARLAHDWLSLRHGQPVALWGLRTGALLAADLARTLPAPPAGLVLWQPITQGDPFLNQFLRIKLAADMLNEGQSQTGTKALRAQLAAGEGVEVGGNMLSADMANELGRMKLADCPPACPTFWLEVGATSEIQVTPASQRVLDAWQVAGANTHAATVRGDPFWATQEITECPELIEATEDALGRLIGGSGSAPVFDQSGQAVTCSPANDDQTREAGPSASVSNRVSESPCLFECVGQRLIGMVARPDTPGRTGVVIIVGGPQYRAGSHRQFTLLARHLAEQDISSLRFDYRGMGDSEGEFRNFEAIDADLRAAVDALIEQVPEVTEVALWGLCDAASAALYYGPTDVRVRRLILLNPWVHSPAGAAKARIKHYYLQRLMQPAFWRKLLSGKVRLGDTVKDVSQATSSTPAAPTNPRHGSAGYIERMLSGLTRFDGRVHYILSGNDLTAEEFRQCIASDSRWKKAMANPRVDIATVPEANHTFSSSAWRDEVERLTLARLVDR